MTAADHTPRRDCKLCHGTGVVSYEYCGVQHGGYACDCPIRCTFCGSYGGTTGTHKAGCPYQPEKFRGLI